MGSALSVKNYESPADRRLAGGFLADTNYIDQHYQSLGMKLITAPATGSKGFRYFLKEPISGEPGFEGRKICGTVSYHPMIEALGGSGVVMGGGMSILHCKRVL